MVILCAHARTLEIGIVIQLFVQVSRLQNESMILIQAFANKTWGQIGKSCTFTFGNTKSLCYIAYVVFHNLHLLVLGTTYFILV